VFVQKHQTAYSQGRTRQQSQKIPGLLERGAGTVAGQQNPQPSLTQKDSGWLSPVQQLKQSYKPAQSKIQEIVS